jgi:GT2 family glycosyltransferase
MEPLPEISFVLATHNRRDITLNTLRELLGASRPSMPFEVIVIDNASTDGTADAIRRAFPAVKLLDERRNLGSCAKAAGVDQARGHYVVFLDDDSYPRPGSVDRMLEHFDRAPKLGAAGFRVHLLDGREECSAFPDVFVGCGVGFRAGALREVGGLDRTFFMQAEEYDLSFRLINAGWSVRAFADLHVTHLKTPCARRSGRTIFYDTRNNLLVAARYLPAPQYQAYRDDWLRRYAWLAAADGQVGAYFRGASAGWLIGRRDRTRFSGRRLSQDAFETLFRWRFVTERMQALASTGVERIVLADLGKNVLAFRRAAAETGLSVLAIGDDRFARPDRPYRGVPIIPLDEALNLGAEAVVVSNTSPVHSAETASALVERTGLPVFDWFGVGGPGSADQLPTTGQNRSTDHSDQADNQQAVVVASAAP